VLILKLTIPILLLSKVVQLLLGITTDYDNEVRAGIQVLPFKLMVQGMHRYRADEFDGKLPYVIVSNSNALSDSYAKLSLAFAAINANLQTSKTLW
jgi:hypothetical protein